MKEIRIVKANDSALPILYSEGWELVSISEGKFYLHREVKRSVVAKPKRNDTLLILNAIVEGNETAHKFAQTKGIEFDTLVDFAKYWLEKGEGAKKHRFEKEKTFDVGLRLERWIKNGFGKRKKEIDLVTFY